MGHAQIRSAGEMIRGRYRIDSLIGEGSFAQVYRGVDTALGRDIAIKMISFNHITKPGVNTAEVRRDTIERFRKEALMVAKLRDHHVVTLFDFGGAENGDLFMALELVEGQTLRERVHAEGPIRPHAVAMILESLLEALREAHTYGLIHRDIKPENVMTFEYMGVANQVRLLDFGIAKALEDHASELTAAGMVLGTPRYVSPERVRKEPIRPASDLYSVGVLSYFMLTGAEIYGHLRKPIDIVMQQTEPGSVSLPEDVQVPDALRRITNRLLQKAVEDRYTSAQQVLDDLSEYLLDVQLTRRSRSVGALPDDEFECAKTEVHQAVSFDQQSTEPEHKVSEELEAMAATEMINLNDHPEPESAPPDMSYPPAHESGEAPTLQPQQAPPRDAVMAQAQQQRQHPQQRTQAPGTSGSDTAKISPDAPQKPSNLGFQDLQGASKERHASSTTDTAAIVTEGDDGKKLIAGIPLKYVIAAAVAGVVLLIALTVLFVILYKFVLSPT